MRKEEQANSALKGFVHQVQLSQAITNLDIKVQKESLDSKLGGLKVVAFIAYVLGALLPDVARTMQTAVSCFLKIVAQYQYYMRAVIQSYSVILELEIYVELPL